MKADVEPLHEAPFHCEAILRSLPGVGLASFSISPNRIRRTPAMVADGNDDLVMVLSVSGTTVVSADGREATLGREGAALMSSAEPSVTSIHTRSRLHCLVLPSAKMAPLVSDLDAALVSAIPGDVEAVRLLSRYVKSLGDDLALPRPELRRIAVTHIYDLAALALGATQDAAAISQERGVRAARLQAIKADIAENASRPVFSIEEVALRQGVTPRYIRRLFEGTGTTFTEYALEQRLLRAHRMLKDPRYDNHPIGSIAFEVGFGDLSYFNRAFRQRFGATPSDIRALAQEKE